MHSETFSSQRRAALDALAADLQRIFRNRLRSVSAYGLDVGDESDTHTIALVDDLSFEDLAACLPLAREWDRRGLAVPLLLEQDEFVRTLDVFPLEYGEIIAHHTVLFGDDPFEGLQVAEADRRRGCELQAKSHLIHLRESFLETRGDPAAIGKMIARSANGFRRLLDNLVILVRPQAPHAAGHADLADEAAALIGVQASLTREVLASAGNGPTSIADPTALLARYIAAVERIWEFVDAWKRR